MTMTVPGLDRWSAAVVPDRIGRWTFHIEAWSDPLIEWRAAAAREVSADLRNAMEVGARLVERAWSNCRQRRDGLSSDAERDLALAAAALRDDRLPLAERIAPVLSGSVSRFLKDNPIREMVTRSVTHEVYVDRRRALFGSWYELFPRSTGGWDADGRPVHGTFQTALEDLPRIADMGFDVVYLTPIHPIGVTKRKGRNGTPTAGPDDPGCPWAIGSRDGGHDAVEPRLGDIEDFVAYVKAASELGLEIAMDFALNCSPDHPWVTEHPEWFTMLPDGSIACAENPPSRWEDIYPLNFDNDFAGLCAEILRVVQFWIDRGVRLFRVDNPHTKPMDFWAWLIGRVREYDPEVVFLGEAFTRPSQLRGLSKLGFSQTFTYFIWRTSKRELTSFGKELAEQCDYLRPNLFPTTHDVLHEILQGGGPEVFAIRATLAATLSPSWGIYSGYEICEHEALRPDSREYLDSEKHQLKPRDFSAVRKSGASIEGWLTRLNAIRRVHPALQQLRTLRFHQVDNDALVAYSKTDPTSNDAVLCVLTLNPHGVERGTVCLDATPGIPEDATFTVVDEVTGEGGRWSRRQQVILDPAQCVARILSVARDRTARGAEAAGTLCEVVDG
jgi:starch synthase (maltosyl-transferring)